MVQQPVQQADGGGVLGQEPAPGLEGPVAGDAERAALVGGGDHTEQQLGAGVVQRREAYFVDDDQVVAQQRADDLADGVVGQAAVEGLGQVGGGVVADLVPGLDRGGAQGDQQVALAGSRRPEQAEILGGGDPFQGGQVLQGRRGDRGGAAVELLQRLGHRERGVAHPGPGVGGVPRRDLGLDQGAQQLLGGPPLSAGGQQQLGGQLANRGELEPPQPGSQVRRQRRRGGGHDSRPRA